MERRRRSSLLVVLSAAVAVVALPAAARAADAFVTSSWVSVPRAAGLGPRGGSSIAASRGASGALPGPGATRRRRVVAAVAEKELDTDAVAKYTGAVAIQILLMAVFFQALDAAVASAGGAQEVPDWAAFILFYGMALRSRVFSPLDNSRPDLAKATQGQAQGQATGGFNDRVMPGWTPPGVFFPIMWVLIVGPLRAASSVLVWQQVGHLCDLSILALMLHLCIGDTWNTINNVERRLGAAVPGVFCVWLSALFAAYTYYQVLPFAGELLLPMCLWITVAGTLIADTWRINNTSGDEPLFPYKGPTRTQYWFMQG